VLIISSFTPIRFFGVLVVVSIFSCLVGALVIMPALVLRFRFRFLEPAETGKKKDRGDREGLNVVRRIAMVFLLAALAAISTSAQDARALIQKSHNVVKVSSFEAVSTLTITDANGNQRIRECSMASMSMPDGTEKRIIKFLSPSEVKGTGILIFDYPEKADDMWIYLPALRKTRRIVSKEKSKSFMGSEFSNSNMTAPGLEDFKYRLIGEETIEGNSCYQIEAIPVSETLEEEYGYSRSVSWVDKNSYLVHRTRYFDFDGELFKTIDNSEFSRLDEAKGTYMVTHMFAMNHSNGRSSEMVMEQVAVTPVKESYFTVGYLEKQ
jgi:outer membrane lipoprotein-sorting protein